MEFPTFHTPWFGNGMVIGVNAIIHVLISHGLAIGLFGMILLADWKSLADYDRLKDCWDRFTRRVMKFGVVVTTTMGAVTGTGIWFTTSALAPRGISAMLRIFFWAWFFEWFLFVGEVVLVLLLYMYWRRLTKHRKVRLAWGVLYMIFAVGSAVVIAAILGFMLTSGQWPEKPNLFTAFFNPSYFPQLAMRLCIATMLGSMVAMMFGVYSGEKPAFKRAVCALYSPILIGSLVLLLLCTAWWYMTVPTVYFERTFFSVLTSRLSQSPELLVAINVAGFAVLFLVAFLGALRLVRPVRYLLVPALILAAAFVAEFERVREFIRGPYLIPGYMYVNGILIEEQPLLQEKGLLPTTPWPPKPNRSAYETGAVVFAHNCSVCHTFEGINGINARMKGRSSDGVAVLVDHTDDMVSFMPPMAASPRERRAAARFLYQWTRGKVEMESLARAIPAPQRPPDPKTEQEPDPKPPGNTAVVPEDDTTDHSQQPGRSNP